MKDIGTVKNEFKELIKELDQRGLSPEPAIAFAAALTMVLQVTGRAWTERLISNTCDLHEALGGLPADVAKSLASGASAAGAN